MKNESNIEEDTASGLKDVDAENATGLELSNADNRNEIQAETLNTIQECLEDLLSKQSLAEDAFIQQHMNTQMYIPLCILAGHHRIESLGPDADVATLLAAAKRSEKLDVDEGSLLIRPLLKLRRNTLILHDLPDGITEGELLELFANSPENESLCSVKPDVNRTAFASFQTDEAAQRGALWLRSQKLRDSEVKCSVKSEHFRKSFFPAVPPVPPGQQSGSVSHGVANQQQVMMWAPYWGTGVGLHGTDIPCDGALAHTDLSGSQNQGCGKGKTQGPGKGEGPSVAINGEAMQLNTMQNAEENVAEILPEPGANDDLHDTFIESSHFGYTHEFRRYTRQQIIEVCDSMENIEKPESYVRFEEEHQDASLFRQSPCKEWAPLPAPISFASCPMLGEGRRSSSSDFQMGDLSMESASGRSARKASSSSWSRRSRSVSGHSGEYHEDMADWDWSGEGDAKPWRRRTRSSRRSTWGEWYGPQWIEKGQMDKEQEWRDQWAPKPNSWAEKVKSSENGVAVQRWQAKSKMEQEDCPVEELATDRDNGIASAAEGPIEEMATVQEGGNTLATEKPIIECDETHEEASVVSKPTWADKVRLGSPKVAPSK